ncbi:GvpL/GvpF family gas vesicle protein [Saccharomonospora sp. NPDC046836]|uniref:GvpL/GvpF family gas vesicle protein n=1 Tax=Saccharomonospora sp. NPDC046836 TaxID=3156921 RepID=UPI0033F0CDAB
MAEYPGRWLYVVTRRLASGALTDLRGVADEPVCTVEAAGLLAVVGAVNLAEYGEQALARHLEDLDWLAAAARAHDTVVAVVSRAASAAVPLRLATVCVGNERVRELLTERHAAFSAALALLAGRTEWGVKAYADPDSLTSQRRPASGGTGTAYLQRRRSQLASREQAARLAAERAEQLHGTLAALAVAARLHRPQDPKLSGRRDWMVLNGAYLVDDARTGEFATVVDQLRTELPGVQLELTGPWPSYSFAGLEEGTP